MSNSWDKDEKQVSTESRQCPSCHQWYDYGDDWHNSVCRGCYGENSWRTGIDTGGHGDVGGVGSCTDPHW